MSDKKDEGIISWGDQYEFYLKWMPEYAAYQGTFLMRKPDGTQSLLALKEVPLARHQFFDPGADHHFMPMFDIDHVRRFLIPIVEEAAKLGITAGTAASEIKATQAHLADLQTILIKLLDLKPTNELKNTMGDMMRRNNITGRDAKYTWYDHPYLKKAYEDLLHKTPQATFTSKGEIQPKTEQSVKIEPNPKREK